MNVSLFSSRLNTNYTNMHKEADKKFAVKRMGTCLYGEYSKKSAPSIIMCSHNCQKESSQRAQHVS